MATQQTHFEVMLNKITQQAKEVALFAHEAEQYEKLAHEWERRALAAEKRLADSVNWEESSEHNFQAYKQEQQKAIVLDARLSKALLHIERLIDEAKVPNWPAMEEARHFLTDLLHSSVVVLEVEREEVAHVG